MPRKVVRGQRRHVPKPSDESVGQARISGGWKGWIKSEFTNKLYKAKEKRNRIRLLAWEDSRYWGLHVWEHTNVGSQQSAYLCMQRAFDDQGWTLYDELKSIIDKLDYANKVKRECPICEDYFEQVRSGASWEERKHLRSTPRTLYFLVDRDEEEKGVQIWSAPHRKIDEEIRKLVLDPQTGKPLPITDDKVGYDIYFDMEVKKTAEGNFPTYTGVQIARNSTELDNAFYGEVFDLREILIVPIYDDLAVEHSGEQEESVVESDGTREAEKDWESKTEEKEKSVVEGALEPSTDDEDCFGKVEHYGKYDDCKEACPDREECAKEVEKKKIPPRRRRQGAKY